MEPNLVDVLLELQAPVLVDQNIHHDQVALVLGGSHSQGGAKSETDGGQVLPGELHPTLWGKAAMQFEGEPPERNLISQVALDCFHVVEVEVMRRRQAVSMANDGLDMFDCLSD